MLQGRSSDSSTKQELPKVLKRSFLAAASMREICMKDRS
jgi:hypothetical protein